MLDSRVKSIEARLESHDKNQDMDSLCGSMLLARAISSSSGIDMLIGNLCRKKSDLPDQA